MDWIGGVLLCFFLLLGILVGLRKLLYMILGDNSGTLCLTLYFCGHVENAEQQLRSALESGQLQEATRNMRPEDSKKLQSVLGSRAQMEKLMKSPQAKALYEKLTGKKSS